MLFYTKELPLKKNGTKLLKVNHKLTINWSMVNKHSEVTRSLNVVNVNSQVYVASSIDTELDQLNEFL